MMRGESGCSSHYQYIHLVTNAFEENFVFYNQIVFTFLLELPFEDPVCFCVIIAKPGNLSIMPRKLINKSFTALLFGQYFLRI